MKNFLGVDKTFLKRSFRGATKLKVELPTDLEMDSIPLEELSSLVENINAERRETQQNTTLDMREFLGM